MRIQNYETVSVSLDKRTDSNSPVVILRQGDLCGTILKVTVLDEGNIVDLRGARAWLEMTTPDDQLFKTSAVNVTEMNSFEIEIDESLAALSTGRYKNAYCRLKDPDTLAISSTSSFTVQVINGSGPDATSLQAYIDTEVRTRVRDIMGTFDEQRLATLSLKELNGVYEDNANHITLSSDRISVGFVIPFVEREDFYNHTLESIKYLKHVEIPLHTYIYESSLSSSVPFYQDRIRVDNGKLTSIFGYPYVLYSGFHLFPPKFIEDSGLNLPSTEIIGETNWETSSFTIDDPTGRMDTDENGNEVPHKLYASGLAWILNGSYENEAFASFTGCTDTIYARIPDGETLNIYIGLYHLNAGNTLGVTLCSDEKLMEGYFTYRWLEYIKIGDDEPIYLTSDSPEIVNLSTTMISNDDSVYYDGAGYGWTQISYGDSVSGTLINTIIAGDKGVVSTGHELTTEWGPKSILEDQTPKPIQP